MDLINGYFYTVLLFESNTGRRNLQLIKMEINEYIIS